MMPRRMSWTDLCVELRNLGARPVRTKGSHQTWRFDDGMSFTVVCNHMADDVPANILVAFRRLRGHRREPDDPAQLGWMGSW